MSENLPVNWVTANLGQVVDMYQGYGFPESLQGRSTGEIGFYKVSDISRAIAAGSEYLKTAAHYITNEEVRKLHAKLIPKDSIVFARIGEAIKLNRRTFLSEAALVDNNVIGVKALEGVDDRYLFYYLKTVHLGDISQATTVPAVRTSDIATLTIQIPPTSEQKRIVSKADELFSGIEEGERALERVRKLVERYRQAVLSAAVTGELTREWREKHKAQLAPGEVTLSRILQSRREAWDKPLPEKAQARGNKPLKRGKKSYSLPVPPSSDGLADLPDSWVWASFDQVSTRITKGSSPKWQGFQYQASGIPFVRSQNIGWGKLELDDVAYLDEGFNQVEKKSIIGVDDVLLNIVGASIGRAAIATTEIAGGNTNQAVANIRPVDPRFSRFLVLYLQSPQCQQRIHSEKVDVARANFNLNQIQELAVPLPTLEEMDEIANQIRSVDAQMGNVLDAVVIEEKRLKALRDSILRAAFSGLLVSQNLADEPASLVLERIQARRSAVDGTRPAPEVVRKRKPKHE